MTSRTTGSTHLQPNSIDSLAQYFQDPVSFLNSKGAMERIEAIKRAGLSSDLFQFVLEKLGISLQQQSTPDKLLDRFTRFLLASRSPQALVVLLQRDPASMESLLQLLAASDWLAECLIDDPESFDLVRMTGGQPIDLDVLVDEIHSECHAATNAAAAESILRRHRRRETLRIAYGDLVQGQPIERTCEQLTFLADAILGAAIQTAARLLDQKRRDSVREPNGTPAIGNPQTSIYAGLEFPNQQTTVPIAELIALSCIATGTYGGKEIDYASRLDLLFVAQPASGLPFESPRSNDSQDAQLLAFSGAAKSSRWDDATAELAEQWAELAISLLTSRDRLGPTYEFTFRLRPRDERNLVVEADNLIRYFELSGRTWHRQEFIKARIAAGHKRLGQHFLERLRPWIYRRYLSAADQEGLRALKRKLYRWTTRSIDNQTSDNQKIDNQTPAATSSEDLAADNSTTTQVDSQRPSSTLDLLLQLTTTASEEIEFAIRFLQLLNGSDLPNIRVGNTLRAIEALEQSGCLTMQERSLLTEHYQAFRKLGHQMQLAAMGASNPVDLELEDKARQQTSLTKPLDSQTGDLSFPEHDPQSLRTDLLRRRGVCRRIVDHLLGDVITEAEEIPHETEMVLDPDFDPQIAQQVLVGYGFASPAVAYSRLLSLATESIRFLSDRRSRHFLARISPKLLEEIASTPNPDVTLERFTAVSDSLGGKAALFELFQTNPSTLRLCVRLCATSPYLTGILTNNPGMVDELIDSLLLDRLPQFQELEAGSRELCRFAEDIEPILHSLKNSAHLRIGVRDVLGRDCIRDTHKAIADTAEVCLRRIAEDAWQFMIDRFGQPLDEHGRPVGLTMLALGKLGGREPNYHSDLDVLFIYDADGRTKPLAGGRRESTNNSHFFHELTQRINKRVNQYGPWGRLYELDARIRFSHDRGGIMAVTIDQFRENFRASNSRLWQRLALVNARIIYRTEDYRTEDYRTEDYRTEDSSESGFDAESEILSVIQYALLNPHWSAQMAEEAFNLRTDLQRGAAPENIKRGAGGTMDVEAIVQMLLLRRAAELQGRLGVGTLEGLDLLRNGGWITIDRSQQLATGYRYLRSVESNLRLMNLSARHDLPQSAEELRPLAFAMRETHLSVVTQKCDAYREINRQLFESIFAEEAGRAVHIQR